MPAILDSIWGVRLGGFANMWLHGYAGMLRSGDAARGCSYRACGFVVCWDYALSSRLLFSHSRYKLG